MKILLLNDDYPPRGRSSVSTVVAGLADGFREKGHDVTILTSHRTEEDANIVRLDGLISFPVSYRLRLRHYHSVYSPHVSRMLRAELARMTPDVVHAHNVHMYLTYDALRIGRQYTSRVFVTMHDVMSFAYGRVATSRFLSSGGRDSTLTVGDHWRVARLRWNPLRNCLVRRSLRKNVRAVVAVSHALKRALEQHGIPRVRVIWNGIDLGKWHSTEDAVEGFRARFGMAGRKVILFGGRLSLDKGSTPILRALQVLRKQVPNVLLFVAGEERRWRGLVEAAQLGADLSEFCRCAGWLARDEMKTACFAVDVVTTPSLCLDAFALTNIEAMAAGKPVVGTCFGGTPEVVEDGRTGFVRDPRDIRQYADALALLLEHPELAQEMGNAGRKRVEEHFSTSLQLEKHLELYQAAENPRPE